MCGEIEKRKRFATVRRSNGLPTRDWALVFFLQPVFSSLNRYAKGKAPSSCCVVPTASAPTLSTSRPQLPPLLIYSKMKNLVSGILPGQEQEEEDICAMCPSLTYQQVRETHMMQQQDDGPWWWMGDWCMYVAALLFTMTHTQIAFDWICLLLLPRIFA